MAKKKTNKVSAKTKVKRSAKKAGKATKKVAKKTGRAVKKAGKKAAEIAGTDMGRAGIGAGVGALALGPIGAVAGAATGLAVEPKRKKKAPKKNPATMVKIKVDLGKLMLDYHDASEHVEHVAASSLRGQKVSLPILKKARADLRKARKEASKAGKEDIDKITHGIDKAIVKKNPSVPSLDAQIGKQRRAKAASAATKAGRKAVKTGAAKKDVKKAATRKKLANINPHDPSLDALAGVYRRRRDRHLKLMTTPGATPGQIAGSKKKLDEAASKLALYAEMRNMDPRHLKLYMEHAEKMKKEARKRKSNPSYVPPAPGNLANHPHGVSILNAAYASARDRGFNKKRSAMQAWAAVENAGYHKDAKGQWQPPKKKNPSPKEKERRRQRKEREEKKKAAKRKERARERRRHFRGKNPSAPKRKTTSEPDRLIRKCQKLWEHYCERPAKKRLKEVFDHLEKMKESKSKRVKEERSRCLRVANKQPAKYQP